MHVALRFIVVGTSARSVSMHAPPREIDHVVGEITCPFAQFGERALLVAEPIDGGDAFYLEVAGTEIWRREIMGGARIVRLGTLPDLNGDHVAEVRMALLAATHALPATHVYSGADGSFLLEIDPRHTKLMWPDGIDGPIASPWPEAVSLGSAIRQLMGDSAHAKFLAELLLTPRAPAGIREWRIASPSGRAGPPGPLSSWVTAKLRGVKFSNSDEVHRDTSPQVPYPPGWWDANLNGDANDWIFDPTLPPADRAFAGDIRSPICYTAGDPVTVSEVLLEVDPPNGIPLFGSVVRGKVGGVIEFTSTSLSYPAEYNGTRLLATISGDAPGQNTIARIADYAIGWEVQTPLSPFLLVRARVGTICIGYS